MPYYIRLSDYKVDDVESRPGSSSDVKLSIALFNRKEDQLGWACTYGYEDDTFRRRQHPVYGLGRQRTDAWLARYIRNFKGHTACTGAIKYERGLF